MSRPPANWPVIEEISKTILCFFSSAQDVKTLENGTGFQQRASYHVLLVWMQDDGIFVLPGNYGGAIAAVLGWKQSHIETSNTHIHSYEWTI